MSKGSGQPLRVREIKRAMTRKQILEASQRLFNAQGYDGTTLEQICAEAVVSVPTLLAYFESKERLALALEYDELDKFRQVLTDPERTEPTLTIWRERVATGAAQNMRQRRNYLNYLKFTESSNALIRHYVYLLTQYEEALGRAIAADFDVDYEADLPSRLLATTLVWGQRAVLMQWRESGGRSDLVAAALAVVDVASEQLPKPGSTLPAARRSAG